ncbi:MAG: hypothetical protein AABX19_03320 [Nanoarchaeota archaeon]
MMNKKGIGNEIDWIIGIGLFLLSIMAIFVLFKPGVNPVYDYDTLIGIVNDNMNNDLTWEITKIPIFIESIPYPDPSSHKSTTIPAGRKVDMILDTTLLDITNTDSYNYIQMDETNRDKFLKETEPLDDTTSPRYAIKDLKEYNMELLYVPGILTDPTGKQYVEESNAVTSPGAETNCNNINLENPTTEETSEIDLLRDYCNIRNCQGPNCIPATTIADDPYSNKFEKVSGGQIAIKGVMIKEGAEKDSKYVLLYSKDPININGKIRSKNQADLRRDYNYNACVVDPYNKIPRAEKSTDQCNARYTVGIKEKLRGLSTYKFTKLNTISCGDNPNDLKGYDCIKEKWGFPNSKEFKIDIYTINQENSIHFPDDKLLPVNANVFARQFNTFVLTDDGKREPVLVSIKVW